MTKKKTTPDISFPCRYLHDSMTAMRLASKHFAFLEQGGLDAFLAMFQKSWNSLFQADLLYRKNGPFVNGNNQIYGIDSFLNNSLHKDYMPSLSIAFSDASDNFKVNLELFRKLRNQSIHENLYQEKEYVHMENFLNPYVRAAFFNYISYYGKVYSEIKKFRGKEIESCHPERLAHTCVMKALPNEEILSKSLKIAVSIYTSEGDNEIRKSAKALESITMSDKTRKDLRVALYLHNPMEHKRREKMDQELLRPLIFNEHSLEASQQSEDFPHYAKDIANKLQYDKRCIFQINMHHINRICQSQGLILPNKGKGFRYVAHARSPHMMFDFTTKEMIFFEKPVLSKKGKSGQNQSPSRDKGLYRTKYSDHMIAYIIAGLKNFGGAIPEGDEQKIAAEFIGVKTETLKLKEYLHGEIPPDYLDNN